MLAGYRAKRAIHALVSSSRSDASQARSARATLNELGSAAVPQLLAALENAPDTRAIEELLAALAGAEGLPHFARALVDGGDKVATAVARALAKSPRLSPSALLDLFETPGTPEVLTTRILEGHRSRISPDAILERIDRADPFGREPLFRLLRRLGNEDQVPGLLRRLDTADPAVRLQIVRSLGLFSSPAALGGLVKCVRHGGHREPRLAALEALLAQEADPPLEALHELLSDPEMIVRNQAIEALVRINRPESVPQMKRLLRSPSADVRRAAVEVLNGVGADDAIGELVVALSDEDWWVRARAGDALARADPAALLDGVRPLIAGRNLERRGLAIDVLRRSKEPRVLELLLADLERPPTLDESEHRLAAIRALGELGDSRAIAALVGQVHSADEALRGAALESLESLADGPQADLVLSAVNEVVDTADNEDLRRASLAAVTKLSRKIRDRESMAPRLSAIAQGSEEEILQMGAKLESEVGKGAAGPRVLDPLALEPGDLLAHRYRIMRQVGRGGFGVVVLAVDEMVRDQIILKFLATHVAGDPSAVERFKHELRYARKITHENVIRIYDIISFGDSLAISMEYFPSHSLVTEIGRKSSESGRRWLGLLQQICAGLAEAHRVKVVHRDLKPGNILINDRNQVKIVDFGLSAAANPGASRLTRSGLVIGTPTYMSPEQIRGGALDGRSDIYSLGVLMYELFTGLPPYGGSDPMALLFQHLEGNAPPPRERNEELSPELEAVIQRAMAVDPSQRFPSVWALSEALRGLPETGAA
jgi:eukaryotic-like serine/threonine-protein kinase